MAGTVKISINRTRGPVGFDPQRATANTGDDIFWTNHDTRAHWPGPSGPGGPTGPAAWLDAPIPGVTGGSPPASSNSISFPASVTGPQHYYCALHPHETGVIIVR